MTEKFEDVARMVLKCSKIKVILPDEIVVTIRQDRMARTWQIYCFG